jgi:cytochrome P450
VPTTAFAPEASDPFSQQVMANPLPFYARLRKEAPAHFIAKYDTWVFSRFQDIVDVLTVGGNAFIASETTLPTPEILLRHNGGEVQQLPLDPAPNRAMAGSPHFEMLRNAHIKPFRPSYVRSLAEMVRELAADQLARGVTFLTSGADSLFMRRGAEEEIKRLRGLAGSAR